MIPFDQLRGNGWQMGKHDPSVSQMIEQARRARPGAIDQLLEVYRNYLRLLARTGIDASLQGKADASDLVQDTLLKAHERFGQFRGHTEAELAAWLRQIMARCLADLIRRYQSTQAREVGRERSLQQLLGRSSQALGGLIAGSGSSPSDAAHRRELSVVLANALADLGPDYREVIVLRSIRELDWDKVAETMDRSQGAVRLLWARALKQLRPLIEARL
jgi:RNA polymerase sigma-70 factor (ECF subfamily)